MFVQPTFSLRYEFQACAYELFLNGGLVACDMSATYTQESQPVNHWLRTGDNQLEARLYVYAVDGVDPATLLQPETALRVELTSNNSGQEAQPDSVLSMAFTLTGAEESGEYSTSASSPSGRFDSFRKMARDLRGDVTVGEVSVTPLPNGIGLQLSRRFSLPVALPSWAFLNSGRIAQLWEADEPQLLKTYEELLAAHEVIWLGLQRRSTGALLPLFEERSRETDQAYHRAPGTTRRRLEQQLEDAFSDGDVALAPLRPARGFWHMLVGSTGMLVSMSRTERASSILCFQPSEASDTEGQLTRSVPVIFRYDGTRFIVSR